MSEMSISSRPFSDEPEILYESRWAINLCRATHLVGALNFPTTQNINLLWHMNTETRRIITIWSSVLTQIKREKLGFKELWLCAHQRDYEDAMTALTPPQISTQNRTRKTSTLVFGIWCIFQLMHVVPRLFPRSNINTIPRELDAYEFLHALSILRWGRRVRYRVSRVGMTKDANPVKWHRDPNADRLIISSPVSPIAIEEPATSLASSNTANTPERGHALPAASGDDNISIPKQGALSDSTGTREVLYRFAGKLCEQLQQVRLSVESDEAEKDENGNMQFSGIDGLVEKYAQTIERSCIGANATNNRALVQLASHCAQMGNQSAKETGRGVDHPGKLFQAAPKIQISVRNNGVSKSRTRPSKVYKTGSDERIQAALNSELADTLKSPDQLDSVDSKTAIELI
ncbi:hypothetical protein PEX1_012750 [Penicillium expansum]|nr:hypothetical protein PEX1_012750 [Penicillium expansum]KGO45389.1 hypothetical protein PEXP_061730 [Penicillium expansum]